MPYKGAHTMSQSPGANLSLMQSSETIYAGSSREVFLRHESHAATPIKSQCIDEREHRALRDSVPRQRRDNTKHNKT